MSASPVEPNVDGRDMDARGPRLGYGARPWKSRSAPVVRAVPAPRDFGVAPRRRAPSHLAGNPHRLLAEDRLDPGDGRRRTLVSRRPSSPQGLGPNLGRRGVEPEFEPRKGPAARPTSELPPDSIDDVAGAPAPDRPRSRELFAVVENRVDAQPPGSGGSHSHGLHELLGEAAGGEHGFFDALEGRLEDPRAHDSRRRRSLRRQIDVSPPRQLPQERTHRPETGRHGGGPEIRQAPDGSHAEGRQQLQARSSLASARGRDADERPFDLGSLQEPRRPFDVEENVRLGGQKGGEGSLAAAHVRLAAGDVGDLPDESLGQSLHRPCRTHRAPGRKNHPSRLDGHDVGHMRVHGAQNRFESKGVAANVSLNGDELRADRQRLALAHARPNPEPSRPGIRRHHAADSQNRSGFVGADLTR